MKLVFLIIVLINISNACFANKENKIIIKIENEIITSFEIKNKIISSLIISGQEINQKNINNVKKQAIESLIQYKLSKIELSKHNIKEDTNQIDKYLKSITSNDITKFKKKFEDNNASFQLFLDEIKTKIKWQTFIYQIYSNRIEIDKKIINQEINNLIKNNSTIVQYKISEIEILINNQETKNQNIENLKKLIKQNGFESTALKYSISSSSSDKGNLGWLNAKSLSDQILQIISKMKIGDVSEPILRQNTATFFKLSDKKISSSQNIDKVELEKNLINKKRNELFNLYSRSHLSKIRSSSLIEYK